MPFDGQSRRLFVVQMIGGIFLAEREEAAGSRLALYESRDSWPAIIAAAAFAALTWWGVESRLSGAMLDTAIVYLLAVVGFIYGGYRLKLSHQWVARHCSAEADDFKDLGKGVEFKEGQFLACCAGAIGLYIGFYALAVSSYSSTGRAAAIVNADSPIPGYTVLITAVMVGVSAAIAARYAIYMRLATMLKEALDAKPEPDVKLVAKLRRAVFRREQIFEPPGNIFVTLGITATFLGLAVGLVTLDLSSFFGAAGESIDQRTARSAAAIHSLKGFIGCMGLALGLSMVGVLCAMFAQWLRGYGPSETTEELLNRSAWLSAGLPPVTTQAKAAATRAKRVKPAKPAARRAGRAGARPNGEA